jgi:hypothetical protein
MLNFIFYVMFMALHEKICDIIFKENNNVMCNFIWLLFYYLFPGKESTVDGWEVLCSRNDGCTCCIWR